MPFLKSAGLPQQLLKMRWLGPLHPLWTSQARRATVTVGTLTPPIGRVLVDVARAAGFLFFHGKGVRHL